MTVLVFAVLISQLNTPAAKPVKYSACRILFVLPQEEVVLSGDTRVLYGETRVEADSVEYELATKQLSAYGSPTLYDGEETVSGDFMRYNVQTGRGTIANAKTEISNGFFEGRRVRKVGDKILNVTSGRFTTCDLEEPHYYFKSSRMRIYLNDMVLCQPVVFYVQGIPVFAVPFWFFPIRKERHSGLLTPRLGQDSNEGRYVKGIAYYQVINDYADATFSMDYMELAGIRFMAEGVYLVRPWISGGVVTSFLEDSRVGKRRWSVNLSHRQKWEDGYNLLLRGDFVSDRSFYREYSENLPERMIRTVDSYVAFSKSFAGSNISLVAQEKRDLEEDASTQMLPQASYSLLPVELFNSVYLSYSSVLVNRYLSGVNTSRSLQNTVRCNAKRRLMGWLNFTPSVSHSEIWRKDEERSYTSSFRVGASTNLYGMSTKKLGKIDGIRHIITPSVSYDLSFQNEDFIERLGFQLRNSFQLRLADYGDLNLLTTTTSGTYDRNERKMSSLTTRFEVNPVPPFNLSCDFGYDPYDRQIDYFNGTFSTFLRRQDADARGFNLSLTQSFRGRKGEAPQLQVWGQLDFNLTRNWFISYSGRYDVVKRTGVSHSLKVVRDLHCWVGELNVRYTKVNWDYDFRIGIKAMPEISLKKGFFSLFLP